MRKLFVWALLACSLNVSGQPSINSIFQWDRPVGMYEKVEISLPGDVDGLGQRQYIRIDRVNYNDKAPWPTEPDGNGYYSLTRKVSSDYGNDEDNWQADTPSPGAP